MDYGAVKTAIGWCAAACSPRGVRAVAIGGRTRDEARDSLFKHLRLPKAAGLSLQWKMPILADLKKYAGGEKRDFSGLTLDMTPLRPFERMVLQAAKRVPYGKTRSYGDIARIIGRPGAYRAVAHALARNPFPIIVPCHRIIGSDGKLCGYSAPGGIALKRRLLRMETGEGKRSFSS